MSKPALTINEPTATGWLRMEMYGDRDKAQDYTYAARTMLGGLRSRMGVNERIAAGEGGGFYHQWSTLSDGTNIHVSTNDGMDTVRIYAPAFSPPALPDQRKRSRKVELTDLLVVGIMGQSNSAQAFLWDGLKTIELPPLPGCTSAGAWQISADGTTVVGYSGNDAFERFATMWDLSSLKPVDIGSLGSGYTWMEATGVSGDGAVICGFGLDSVNPQQFRWTAKTGVVALPGSYMKTEFTSDGKIYRNNNPTHHVLRPAISQNGRHIVGTMKASGVQLDWGEPYFGGPQKPYIGSYDVSIYTAAIWTDDKPGVVLAGARPDYAWHFITYMNGPNSPRWIYYNYTDPDPAVYTPIGGTVPRGVSDDGLVVVGSLGGGESGDGGNGVGFVWTGAFTWISPPQTDSTIALAQSSCATCITPDGAVIGGFDIDRPDFIPTAWSAASATTRSVIATGEVRGMNEKGTIFVGAGGPSAANYDFMPAMWKDKGNETLIDLLPGQTSGYATSCAVLTKSVEEDD